MSAEIEKSFAILRTARKRALISGLTRSGLVLTTHRFARNTRGPFQQRPFTIGHLPSIKEQSFFRTAVLGCRRLVYARTAKDSASFIGS